MPTTTVSLLVSFQAFLHQNAISNLLFAPLCLILADVVTGIASALKRHVFEWKRLADFLGKDFLHYIVVVLLVALVYLCIGQQGATTLATIAGMGALSTSLFGSILQNCNEISPTATQVAKEVAPMVGLPPVPVVSSAAPAPIPPVSQTTTVLVPPVSPLS